MKKYFLLLIFSVLTTVPLHAQKVITDYDTKIDFKKFRTYAWLAPGDSVLNRHRSDKVYGDAIMYFANQELKSRGLKMDTLRPDAIFVFYTTVKEITTYSQSPTLSVGVGVVGPGYFVGGAVPVAGGKVTATIEEDGVLNYVMYDTETKKMVWSGMVEKQFTLSDDVQELLRVYTIKIFKKYPVKNK
jgi:hypothetical protein